MADTIKTNLGPVTAYADAKAHGYTGTREEFGVLLANAGLNLKAAETAKADAEAAKQAAETAQQAAASSATAAKASEAAAEKSAQGAAASESAAKAAQTAAETAKANADTAASNAAANATAAANSAADAKNTADKLPEAINDALAQAAASGEFDGLDGHSPVVTATKSGKTTTISVDGTDIATVEDGVDGAPGSRGADGITPTIGDNGNWYLGAEDTGKPSRGAIGAPGKDGAPGAAGHTPCKGTDYWTAADKQEIVNDVLAALPDGTEAAY